MEKNNAYDSHLMLESYPLCSQHMVKLAEEVCDDDPIEADGVWFRLNLLFPRLQLCWVGKIPGQIQDVSRKKTLFKWSNMKLGPRAPSCLGSGYINKHW